MCLTVGGIGIGMDVQAIYKEKKADGYLYERLPENKIFYNLFSLTKENVRFIVGSNRSNSTAMFVSTKSIPISDIEKNYILYLEAFFKFQLKPMPEKIKQAFAENDSSLVMLNGASNSNNDMLLIAKSPDKENPENMIWTTIVISPSSLGIATTHRSLSTQTHKKNDSLDMWDILSGVGALSGIYSLF